ncbi:hypothetical protein H2200_009888 [Cladophialophora chaetospira]|uniref:Uncharacterized protein n=1 Tax=Cladophialophora chaetospira TaxID=386627 RepID=A0AA38X3C4_9EURO|nr:hypothetical protein H2200_009888 [Cladophialophora chaetospira]
MPNKKSKANAFKVKPSATPELTQNAPPPSSGPVEPPTTTSASHAVPALPPPNFSDDFWTKNARAKALIMSTLVPGTEAWKIAEPIELASNIMKALEEKYAPKDANGKPLRGKELAAWDKEHRGKQHSTKSGVPPPSDVAAQMLHDPTSSDFIGDFVAGRPMEKYLNMYKDKLAHSNNWGSSHAPESRDIMFKETRNAQIASSLAHMANTGTDEIKPHPDHPPIKSVAAMLAEQSSETKAPAEVVSQPPEEPDLPIPETFDLPAQPTSPIPSSSRSISSRWKPQSVKHDSYLSEYQADIFAQHDLDRKKQIQVAATKVLMQKLPTRDLRLLWAVLYGGETAPWPGTCSIVIPGVTSTQWGNKNYGFDYKTAVWSWNNKTGDKD